MCPCIPFVYCSLEKRILPGIYVCYLIILPSMVRVRFLAPPAVLAIGVFRGAGEGVGTWPQSTNNPI